MTKVCKCMTLDGPSGRGLGGLVVVCSGGCMTAGRCGRWGQVCGVRRCLGVFSVCGGDAVTDER